MLRFVIPVAAVLVLGACSGEGDVSSPAETVTASPTEAATEPVAAEESPVVTQDRLEEAATTAKEYLTAALFGDCTTSVGLTFVDPERSDDENEALTRCEFGQRATMPGGELIVSFETGRVRPANREPDFSDGALDVDPNATDVFFTVTLKSGEVLDARLPVVVVGDEPRVFIY